MMVKAVRKDSGLETAFNKQLGGVNTYEILDDVEVTIAGRV